MKEANSKLEDDVLQWLERIEREKDILMQTQTQVEGLKAQIETASAQIAVEVATLEEELRLEQSDRDKLAMQVDADLCARYERIFAKRSGLAVVEIRAGTCRGCHMRIPPHMDNQILSNVQQNTGMIFSLSSLWANLLRKLEPEAPPSVSWREEIKRSRACLFGARKVRTPWSRVAVNDGSLQGGKVPQKKAPPSPNR